MGGSVLASGPDSRIGTSVACERFGVVVDPMIRNDTAGVHSEAGRER
jgi:hypothetical protein